MMEERREITYADDEINLGEYFSRLRPHWWKIALLSLAVGIITLLVMLRMPNIYQATAVITSAADEGKKNPALGALSLFGVDIGGPSTIESLETLFKSNDLTVRVFRKYDLWPVLLADRYDPSARKTNNSWTDRLFGREKKQFSPGDWDAIRVAKKVLKISINKKSNILSLSVESPSAESSANIVKYYLEEGKNRLQEEALERAGHNKEFITEQISKTIDPLTRDRLYALYGQEVEREMMARNREQFGFRVIDSPRVPDRKFGPARVRAAAVGTVLSFLAMTVGILLWKGVARGSGGGVATPTR